METDVVLMYAGLLAGPVYLAAIVLASAGRPGYSHRLQFLSELGVPTWPGSAIFRIGLTATGVLLVVFAYGLGARFETGGTAIAEAMAVFGITSAMMGVFSCDPGCPRVPISRSGVVHAVSGLVGGVSVIAAALLSGLRFLRGSELYALYSLVTAAASLVVLVLLTASRVTSPGVAQRIFVMCVFSWIAATAWLMSRTPWPSIP